MMANVVLDGELEELDVALVGVDEVVTVAVDGTMVPAGVAEFDPAVAVASTVGKTRLMTGGTLRLRPRTLLFTCLGPSVLSSLQVLPNHNTH